jgi:hypothetical protein
MIPSTKNFISTNNLSSPPQHVPPTCLLHVPDLSYPSIIFIDTQVLYSFQTNQAADLLFLLNTPFSNIELSL